MSRAARIAIIAGIIVAAIAAGIVATIAGDQQENIPENGDESEGRQLTLDFRENLTLKENP